MLKTYGFLPFQCSQNNYSGGAGIAIKPVSMIIPQQEVCVFI